MAAAERKRVVGQRALALALAPLLASLFATRLFAQSAQPQSQPQPQSQAQSPPQTSAGIAPTEPEQQPEASHHGWLPSEPFTFFGGRLVVSGDATISYGTHDKGYFDTQDYYHDAFSVMRLSLTSAFRANDHLSILGQVTDDVALRGDRLAQVDRQVFRIYALYVRVRPWTSHAFDIQAGRIPPVFGAFARQSYGTGNPLIGVPLPYQYETTLRGDALPGTQQALLNWRGGGWSVRYTPSIGPRIFESGMPIISLQQWDTGVQAHWGNYTSPVNVSFSVTNGTLGYPQTGDNNSGKQLAGRVSFRPDTGLIIGLSAARGEFLDRGVANLLPPGSNTKTYAQRAFGVDSEYSRGYWLVRGEAILSDWGVPEVGPEPPLRDPLRAWATFVETTWRFSPRWYFAARAEHMGFSKTWSASYVFEPWDAPVTRGEAGVGYTFARNIRGKITYQQNWREARRKREGIAGVQLIYWF